MDAVIFLKMIFSGLNLLELIAIIILTVIFTVVFIKFSFIKYLWSWSGFGIVFIILCFSATFIKINFLLFEHKIDELTINNSYLTTNFIGKRNKKIPAVPINSATNTNTNNTTNNNTTTNNNDDTNTSDKVLDDGSLITELPPNREINKLKYSALDVKNSLDKIVNDYGYEIIPYLQRVVLEARKFEDSKEVIYMRLEDYAFLCSMNLCGKYLYDFSDIKNEKGGFFLVLVVPEFVSGLENYSSD